MVQFGLGVKDVLEPLSVAIGIAGMGDLFAIWRGIRWLRYVFKPGTMLLIIALAATGLPEAGAFGYLVLAGLLFSVAGDVFLVLPQNRFLAGLVSFFCAHVLYIAAFAVRRAGWGLLDGALLAGLVAAGVLFVRRMRPGVRREGGNRMLLATGVYLAAITLMVAAAVGTRLQAAAAGALLFDLSDAILAWNRFVRPLPRANLGVMSAYFLGQYLIAVSVLIGG